MASMGQKYLVVSDNHGNMSNLEYVIERFRGKIEALIHCGDMEIPPEMLEELAGCPVYMSNSFNFFRSVYSLNPMALIYLCKKSPSFCLCYFHDLHLPFLLLTLLSRIIHIL